MTPEHVYLALALVGWAQQGKDVSADLLNSSSLTGANHMLYINVLTLIGLMMVIKIPFHNYVLHVQYLHNCIIPDSFNP